MKKALLFTVLCTLFVACGNMSSQELETEMASGVVLVQNQSYYELAMPGVGTYYFTSYDNEDGLEGLTDDKDSIQYALSYGTGFFISDNGQIATNMHVVSGSLEDKDFKSIKNDITDFFDEVRDYIKDERNEASELREKLVDSREDYEAYDYLFEFDEEDKDDYRDICEAIDALDEAIDEYDEALRELDHLHLEDAEITYHNQVSIAYNDTHVTSTKDFIPCVVTKKDEEHDLAIIELKDKKTPKSKHVFNIPESDPLENYDFNDKITKTFSDDKNSQLHMTSFNYGPLLAINETNLKSQFNIGTISQRSDDKLMYSIPALSGSSGSPVVNRRGELVAINHAKLLDAQNFNYGIKVKHLRKLVEQ